MEVNLEGDPGNKKIPNAKKRGFWLRLWLLLYVVASLLCVYGYFVHSDYYIQIFPKLNTVLAYFQGVLFAVGLIFAFGVFNWKKWGVYGVIIITVITVTIDTYVFMDVMRLMGSLVYGLIFCLLVKKRWHYFN